MPRTVEKICGHITQGHDQIEPHSGDARRVALLLLPHGADSLQQALGSLGGFGIDREGIDLLCSRQGFESC